MKIDVLYFEGCPNHLPAVARVKEVVAELGITAEIVEVSVRTPEEAVAHRFFGSPSIHVEGKDIDPSVRGRDDYAFSCRLYGASGVPPKQMLAAALRGGDGVPVPRAGWGVAGGAIMAAIGASACCWLPLLLIAFGVSAGGVSAWFSPYRPILLTLAVLLLAFGFYRVYRHPPTCAPGSACATPRPGLRRINHVVLWVAALLVGLFAFFPNYGSWFVTPTKAQSLTATPTPVGTMLTLNIGGMTCEMCAVTLKNNLTNVPGVVDAQVSYVQSKATLMLDTTHPPTRDRLIAAVEQAGYQVIPTDAALVAP